MVVGLGTQFCTRGVRELGIRMLTFDTKTSLYVEDRVLQVPMVLEYDKIVGLDHEKGNLVITINTVQPTPFSSYH